MFRKHSKILVIDGVKTPIDPDFRIMCEYSEAVSGSDTAALRNIAARFYFAALPEGVNEKAAANAMVDFYVSGFASGKKSKSSVMEAPEPSFDFEEDEGYFYAAFLSEYGIDLNTAKLHWLDFCALFRGLPDDCKLKQIIGIRAQSLSDIKSSAERARILKLKTVFALKKRRKQRFKDTADRDKAMIEDIKRIHLEARKKRGEEG